MSIQPPTRSEVEAAARHYGFTLGQQDLAVFHELVTTNLDSHRRVAELYELSRSPGRQRHWSFPRAQDNPLGAWSVRTTLRGAASGPLSGRTVAVKDNIGISGVPMSNGSKSLHGHVSARDATVVERLLAAGAEITGTSVCEDLCFSGASHTSVTGPVRNPWETSRTTGGSSSGSAALVSAGEVDLALGGDQGGSIRIPAAFCGVVGHKPTHGLVPYTGVFPVENTIDHVGPITGSVADAALVLSAIAGPDGRDPRQKGPPEGVGDQQAELARDLHGLRIGLLDEGFARPDGTSDPEVDEQVRQAAHGLVRQGAVVEPVSVPWHRDGLHVWNVIGLDGTTAQMLEGNGFGTGWEGLYDPELIEYFAQGRREHADALSPSVKLAALTGRCSFQQGGNHSYAMARNLVHELRAAYDAALSRYDALVLPTVPFTAPELVSETAPVRESIAASLSMVGNTAPFNASGHPATSVPAGFAHDLPVGMMIVAPHFQDHMCLRLAAAAERANRQASLQGAT